jgi:hypothetical protein
LAKGQPRHPERDLNYKFNLWPHLKLFSEAIKSVVGEIGARGRESITIINHFNLIILYEEPTPGRQSKRRRPRRAEPALNLHPETYFMCHYHGLSQPLSGLLARVGAGIDGHLTKLLRSTLIFSAEAAINGPDDGQRSIIIKQLFPEGASLTFLIFMLGEN